MQFALLQAVVSCHLPFIVSAISYSAPHPAARDGDVMEPQNMAGTGTVLSAYFAGDSFVMMVHTIMKTAFVCNQDPW